MKMLKYLVLILISLVSLQVNGQIWSNPNPSAYGLQWQGFKATKGIIFGTDTSRKEAGTAIIIGDTLYVANGTFYRKFGYADISSNSGSINGVYSGLGLSNVNDSTLKVDTASAVILSRQRAAATYEPIITAGTNLQYWRGDKTWQTFPTDLSSFTNGPGYITEIPVASFTWRVRDSVCDRPSYDLDDGDKFLVCPSPVALGEFDGYADQIATYHSGVDTFSFEPATSGDYLQNSASGAVDKFNGTLWVYQNERKKLNNGGELDSMFASFGNQLNYGAEIKTNNIRRWFWQSNGQVRIATAPTTYSGGGYDLLVRNPTSKNLEKIPSSTFVAPADTANKWISDLRRTPGSTTVEKKIGSTWSTAFIDSTGGGAGASGLQANITYDPVLTTNNTINHAGYELNYTGTTQNYTIGSTFRVSAVDSLSLNSTNNALIQAADSLVAIGASASFSSTTKTRVGYNTGTGDSTFIEFKSTGSRWLGLPNVTNNARYKTLAIDTTGKFVGYINNSSGTPLTTDRIGVGIASLLDSYSTFTYDGTTQTINNNNIGSTQTTALSIRNTQTATTGNPQYSGRLEFGGANFSTGGSGSADVRMGISMVTQSAATPVNYLGFFPYAAGTYSTTPVFSVYGNSKVGINTTAVTSNVALDITAPSGGSPLVIRDPTGSGSLTFTVPASGATTLNQGLTTTGTFTGELSTGTGGIGAVNFYAKINSTIANGQAAAIGGSANTTAVRLISNPTTTATPTANQNYATFYLGKGSITEASSGTHDLMVTGAIIGPNIVNGSGTTTKAAALYLEPATGTGAPSNENNLSLYVYSGPSQINGSIIYKLVAKTANYTATTEDRTITGDATSGVITITLPTAVGKSGIVYIVKKIDASGNAVNVASTSSQTFDGAASPYALATQWKYAQFQSDGANWIIIGNN